MNNQATKGGLHVVTLAGVENTPPSISGVGHTPPAPGALSHGQEDYGFPNFSIKEEDSIV